MRGLPTTQASTSAPTSCEHLRGISSANLSRQKISLPINFDSVLLTMRLMKAAPDKRLQMTSAPTAERVPRSPCQERNFRLAWISTLSTTAMTGSCNLRCPSTSSLRLGLGTPPRSSLSANSRRGNSWFGLVLGGDPLGWDWQVAMLECAISHNLELSTSEIE